MPKLYQQGSIDVVVLDERLSGDDVLSARQLCAQVLGGGLPQVVLDLSRVRVLDSAGLEWLCDLADDCRRHGGEALLAAPSSLVRDILRITGIDERIGVNDNVIAAVGVFSQ